MKYRTTPAIIFLGIFITMGMPLKAQPSALPAWVTAHERLGPLDAEETRAFMKQLVAYIRENHLKTKPDSEQRGMIYEYFRPAKKGKVDQFVQGEGLDTMHDGAWFGAALGHAYLATGDAAYLELLEQWVLPFYLKMLNHSDTLFAGRSFASQKKHSSGWIKERKYVDGEKGFVPYWWDDGNSVSNEREREPNPLPAILAYDALAGKPNPQAILSGFSAGTSPHMAQDIAVMLEVAGMIRKARGIKDSLTSEIADGARNLHESRIRHNRVVPMCAAAVAVTSGMTDELRRSIQYGTSDNLLNPTSKHSLALNNPPPGGKCQLGGHIDALIYPYYMAVAKEGEKLPDYLAFNLMYHALVTPRLFDGFWIKPGIKRPPGMNIFDLGSSTQFSYVDKQPHYLGKPLDHPQNQQRFANGVPPGMGSRLGPETMMLSGLALQLAQAHPGAWTKGRRTLLTETEEQAIAALRRELGGGLRTWKAVFDDYGYIPSSIGGNAKGNEYEQRSDSTGYAHLLNACAQWLNVLEGRRDWDLLLHGRQ